MQPPMNEALITKRRAAVVALVLAVCVGPWGCALSRQRSLQPPSDEVRAQFNTIGLPAARFLPEANLKAPTSGKGWGAAKGAGYGVAAGAGPGLAIASSVRGCHGGREIGALVCGTVLLFGLGVAAAGGTVGALGGAVYGAVTAEPASRISAAESELKSAVVDLNVQETLRDHVLRTGRDRSSLNFVALDDRGPTAVGEPIDYRALASEGVDTVVEVSVPRIRLAGKAGINPPVALFMTARARVIRTADGAELYAETFEYGGGSTYKFLEWAAAGGLAFRQEMDRGTRSLAGDIAQLLFPGSARDNTPAEQSVEPVGAATASSEPLAGSTPAAGAPAPETVPARSAGSPLVPTVPSQLQLATREPSPGESKLQANVAPAMPTPTPAKEAELAPQPVATIIAAPVDLRAWLPGEWDTSGGATQLTISTNLSWDYTSTVRGRWRASGTAYVEDPDTVVLRGWFEGTDAIGRSTFKRESINITLRRESESLAGELILSRPWPVTFLRAPRPAAEKGGLR